jgi:hypothetical protein
MRCVGPSESIEDIVSRNADIAEGEYRGGGSIQWDRAIR